VRAKAAAGAARSGVGWFAPRSMRTLVDILKSVMAIADNP